MDKKLSGFKLSIVLLSAAALFGPLFLWRGFGPLDFWWSLSGSVFVLVIVASCIDNQFWKRCTDDLRSSLPGKIRWGVASACFLYLVYLAADHLSALVFAGSRADIDAVYGLKAYACPERVFLLIFLVIGPGEELFWRVFMQEHLVRHFGAWRGVLLAAAAYAAVHLGSFNLMLILAALTCGLFWGALYQWRRSMAINVISHTVWDLLIFLFIPLH